MVDYSKWKDIEISDDEDDTHPNIDTPSLFRWRHQARVERMQEKDKDKAKLEEEKKRVELRMKQAKMALEEADRCADPNKKMEIKERAKKQIADLQTDFNKVSLQTKEMEKKEKMEPWNIDTISKEGFSKSIINTDTKDKEENLSEEEKGKRMKDYIKEHKKEIKEYGMFKKFDDSRKYMMEHPVLAHEYAANYLVLWCIDLELEEKNTLMRHVAHQAVCLQFILELAKQLDRDPRSCISAFFHRIQQAKDEYKQLFDDELTAFISRIENRAKEKIQEAMEEAEQEEKAKRMGPGGLDPVEVIETLPAELRACFESQDIGKLKGVIASMPPADAAYHMKRCVQSGLWVPEGGAQQEEGVVTSSKTGLLRQAEPGEESEEEVYESVEDTVD